MSRLTSVTDRDGNAVTVTYNSDGTIHSITDAAGRVTVLSYNGQKLCSSLVLSDGREATFEYDSEQHLIRSVDFNGAVSPFDYGQNGAMSSVNAAGKVATFEMDTLSLMPNNQKSVPLILCHAEQPKECPFDPLALY